MNEKPIDIKAEISEALKLISVISVAGDAVDYMAIARKHLKTAIKELDKNAGCG